VRCLTILARFSMVTSSVLPMFTTSRWPAPGNEAEESLDGVAHVAEATGLLAIPIYFDRLIFQGALHEIRQHHAIAAGLPRPYRIEEAHHDDRLLFLLPIGDRQEFVEGLGGGIAPAPLGGRTKNEVGVLMERHLGVLAIDLEVEAIKRSFFFCRRLRG